MTRYTAALIGFVLGAALMVGISQADARDNERATGGAPGQDFDGKAAGQNLSNGAQAVNEAKQCDCDMTGDVANAGEGVSVTGNAGQINAMGKQYDRFFK